MIFGSHLFKQKEFEQSRKHGMNVLVIGKGTDGVRKICQRALRDVLKGQVMFRKSD